MKVMSLNIWNYNAPWEARRELIAEVVRAQMPDIVGFQEIRNDFRHNEGGKNQAEQLSERLPEYRFVYQPAMVYFSLPRIEEGLAVFSRHPIVAASHLPLTRDESDAKDNHQRIVLQVMVETPAGRVHLFNTHFSLSPPARCRNVVELDEFTRTFDAQAPQILVGDFNAEPGETPIEFLTGRGDIEGRRGDFRDAWRAFHPAAAGYTFSSDNPQHRIDYIFLRGGVEVKEIRLIADRASEEGVFPSDHRGLVAEVRWGENVV